MQIFGLKACDTCRKAIKSLPGAQFVDVREDGVPQEILQKAIAEFPSAIVNTRSTTWRGLPEAERAQPALDLILAHPALMKRPLIVDGAKLYLGWTPDVQAAL